MYSDRFQRSKSRLLLTVVCASLSICCALASTANIPALSQPTNRPSLANQAPAPAVIRSIRQAVKKQLVIKTLSIDSPQERLRQRLNAFKKVLENRQFPNLNGLTYLTNAALADYPTTTYQSQSAATQFIDLEKPSLPKSLRESISSWESLIAPVKQ
jgi:virulence-associated protein VapD